MGDRGRIRSSGGFHEIGEPLFSIEVLDGERSIGWALSRAAPRRRDGREMGGLVPGVDLGGRRASEALVGPEEGIEEKGEFEPVFELALD